MSFCGVIHGTTLGGSRSRNAPVLDSGAKLLTTPDDPSRAQSIDDEIITEFKRQDVQSVGVCSLHAKCGRLYVIVRRYSDIRLAVLHRQRRWVSTSGVPPPWYVHPIFKRLDRTQRRQDGPDHDQRVPGRFGNRARVALRPLRPRHRNAVSTRGTAGLNSSSIERRSKNVSMPRVTSCRNSISAQSTRSSQNSNDRTFSPGFACCMLTEMRTTRSRYVIVSPISRRRYPSRCPPSSAQRWASTRRSSTTVADAYVHPIFKRYVQRLVAALEDMGITRDLLLVLSDGCTVTHDTAVQFPIRLVQSGPAAGAQAAVLYGGLSGVGDLLCFDMGGTTAKACLIEEGEPQRSASFEVARVFRFAKAAACHCKSRRST